MSHQPSAAESLRDWRENDAKATQTKLARDLDVRPNTVCEWEKGSRRPDLPNALRLQHMSAGRVPAVAWGYEPEECERLLTAMVNVARGAADASDLAHADTIPPTEAA